MKKSLAILLTLILTFSCFSILSVGTVSAEEVQNKGQILFQSDFSDVSKWRGSNVSTLDEDDDGTKDFVRLNTGTGVSTALYTPTVVLKPGYTYEYSFDIRVPEGEGLCEQDFASYVLNETTYKLNPKFSIYQPGNTASNEKPSEGLKEGTNNYAYNGNGTTTIIRRKDFVSYWTVGDYATYEKKKYSSFTSDHYSACKDAEGNGVSPNTVYKDWTTVTATFTAIDDENNLGDTAVSFGFSLDKVAGLAIDVKNIQVKCIKVPAVPRTLFKSDFANGVGNFRATTGKYSATQNKAEVTLDKENALVKIASHNSSNLLSELFTMVPGNDYELSFEVKIPEESGDFMYEGKSYGPAFAIFSPNVSNGVATSGPKIGNDANNNLYADRQSNVKRREDFEMTWNFPGRNPWVEKDSYFDQTSHRNITTYKDDAGTTVYPNPKELYSEWTTITATFTAVGDTAENMAISFGTGVAYEGWFFYIRNIELIETPNSDSEPEEPEQPEQPEEPEEPAVLRGPEVDEGFEDFTAGTKLYDNTLTGTQNMYTYTSKGKLLTGFGDLTVSNQGGYNGSKQSLTGRTYYQYAAMPLALDANTEYELSFWYTYTTNDADIYLEELFYGIVKPVEGSAVSDSILHGGGGTLRMKEYFAPDEFEMGKWRKATLKFSTGANTDGLVFAYSYSDTKKSDVTASPNQTPLYIDDVKIKKVENAPEKVNITIDHKDAASVEITSGYFKDFVIGEKIQFKVRTKDALVPTVTVNGNVIEANNGYYTYTITESDVAIKVECEGDENRADPNNYNGLPLYEYNQEVAVTPVWEGNVVYHETALFTTGRETAKLLYPIDKVVAVRSYDLTKTYFEGVDYEIAEDGTLRILEGSQIPVYKGALETSNESSFKFVGKENAYAHFVDNYEYAAYAVNVTYEHSDVWTGDEGYNPEAVQSVADKIPGVIEKLEKGEDVEVVILGDSLSCGSSTSGQAYDDLYNDKGGQNINTLNYAPFTPSWPVMLEQTLKTLYPDANITFKNIAHGGKTAKWGSERLLTRLGYLERDFGWTYETPDLLILAYGGNDLTAGYTAEQFKGYMQSIITQYRGYKQDENAEVLLWTETRHHTQVTQYTHENHEAYQQVMYDLADENGSIGVVDTLNVFNEVVQSKPETDLFSDCVIHVNDFATRVIVQCFVAALTSEKAEEEVPGDFDTDGVVNADDVALLAKYFADWEGVELDPSKLDISGDGLVNLYDLVKLAQIAAKW